MCCVRAEAAIIKIHDRGSLSEEDMTRDGAEGRFINNFMTLIQSL